MTVLVLRRAVKIGVAVALLAAPSAALAASAGAASGSAAGKAFAINCNSEQMPLIARQPRTAG